MPRHRKLAPKPAPLPVVTPETLGELVTLDEVVAASKLSRSTIYRATRRGELRGFIPGGRDPRRAGRMGYRYHRRDVLAWLYGAAGATLPGTSADPAA